MVNTSQTRTTQKLDDAIASSSGTLDDGALRKQIPLPLTLAIVAVILASALLAFRYLPVYRGVLPEDFDGFLRAGEKAQNGLSPYAATEAAPFWDSPGSIAIFGALPRDPELAWQVYVTLSILALGLPLLFMVSYRTLRQVTYLLIGLVLGWKGVLGVLDLGQSEMLLFGFVSIAAATFETLPFFSGLSLGLMASFKLPWALMTLPFFAAARIEIRRREHRFRRFLAGYLAAWLAWLVAIPSLVFGKDQTVLLTREWIKAFWRQYREQFVSESNQSVWISAVRWAGGVDAEPHRLLIAMGIATILVGITLGRLLARLDFVSGAKIRRGRALAWIAPWLMFAQWVNPLAWKWGNVFAVAAPFAWWAGGLWGKRRWTQWLGFGLLAALWLTQQSSALQFTGVVSIYWLVLVWVSSCRPTSI